LGAESQETNDTVDEAEMLKHFVTFWVVVTLPVTARCCCCPRGEAASAASTESPQIPGPWLVWAGGDGN